jgi:hypothetical protein
MGTDVDRFGYLRAVNGATVAFAFLFAVKGIVEGVASGFPFSDLVWLLAILIFLVPALFWLFAFVAAVAPFAATYALARWLGIRSALYYALCGALTSLILTLVFVAIPPGMVWQGDSQFWQECLTWSPILIASGVCGALAFWHKTGRHLGRAPAKPEPVGRAQKLP